MEREPILQRLRIDHSQKVPMYYQIVQNLSSLYLDGALHSGMMLPSEWDLAEAYQVSRLTVRQALKELEKSGLIRRRPGVGTFISAPTAATLSPGRLGFTQRMHSLGKRPGSKILTSQVLEAQPDICERLQLPLHSAVIELVRVRTADDDPIMLETTYLPHMLFPNLQANLEEGDSLYETFKQKYGVVVAAVEQELRPVLLTAEQARHLQCESGLPAMRSQVTSFDSLHRPLEYTLALIHGEKCRFLFRFREEGGVEKY